jgi:hypothetical protein
MQRVGGDPKKRRREVSGVPEDRVCRQVPTCKQTGMGSYLVTNRYVLVLSSIVCYHYSAVRWHFALFPRYWFTNAITLSAHDVRYFYYHSCHYLPKFRICPLLLNTIPYSFLCKCIICQHLTAWPKIPPTVDLRQHWHPRVQMGGGDRSILGTCNTGC